MAGTAPIIRVRDLEMRYGDRVIQKDLNFDVPQEKVFIIMGGSGCGKSTLLRHMVGLNRPARGDVFYRDESLWAQPPEERERILRHTGVLFQSGALWSSLTLEENITLLLEEYTDLAEDDRHEVAQLKLSLVGLAGFGSYYPSEISGGMRKRAGLARAMALDPDILYFDEPSAGLDPISSRSLDELIVELRDSFGTTIVMVTHELASIFGIGDECIYLDNVSHTMIARGSPQELLEHPPQPIVREFLSRGEQ